jgi:hypothetical protein
MEKLFTMVRVGDAVEILGDRDAELHMCSEATRTKQRSQRYELSKTAGNEGMRTFEQRCESTVEL